MQRRRFLPEQEFQLLEKLLRLGLEHGDTVRADLYGVGVVDGDVDLLHHTGPDYFKIAFCPPTVNPVSPISRGSRAQRRIKIPEIVTICPKTTWALQNYASGHGFIPRLGVTLEISYGIHLFNAFVDGFIPISLDEDVNRPWSFNDYCFSQAM